MKLLVLGGTGLVGSHVCKEALRRGHSVVSFTRRGSPTEDSPAYGLEGVEWEAGDASNARAVLLLVKRIKPDAVVHCIGVLFDCNSWLAGWNKTVSGCGSVPDAKKGTYENVIKNTAMAAFHAIAFLNEEHLPFVYVSVCEAGWHKGDMGPLGSLAAFFTRFIPSAQEYLLRKREVEDAMLYGIGVPDICKRRAHAARPVVFRPSVVLTDEHPRPCLSSLFTMSPFSDGPIRATDLASAMVAAVEQPSVRGVYRRRDILKLGARE